MAERRRSRARPGRRDDRGGIIVEFAAVVPFLMLALALVWQVVLIGLTSMYTSHAAAEGARQAAVTPNEPIVVNQEALRRIPPPWDDQENLHILTEERGGTWYTQVTMYVPVLLPGVSGPWSITGEAMVVHEVEPRETVQ